RRFRAARAGDAHATRPAGRGSRSSGPFLTRGRPRAPICLPGRASRYSIAEVFSRKPDLRLVSRRPAPADEAQDARFDDGRLLAALRAGDARAAGALY